MDNKGKMEEDEEEDTKKGEVNDDKDEDSSEKEDRLLCLVPGSWFWSSSVVEAVTLPAYIYRL